MLGGFEVFFVYLLSYALRKCKQASSSLNNAVAPIQQLMSIHLGVTE